jgi:DNA-directed RNA polymerase alpha subunit
MARNYRKEYDNYHSSGKQKKNRAARNAARNSLEANGRVKDGEKKDVHHRDGNPLNNDSSNLVVTSRQANRRKNRAGGGMAKDKNWIQKAIKNPGSLRKKAGVKKGQDISKKELSKLSNSRNSTTRKQANLAKTLSKMNTGGQCRGSGIAIQGIRPARHI